MRTKFLNWNLQLAKPSWCLSSPRFEPGMIQGVINTILCCILAQVTCSLQVSQMHFMLQIFGKFHICNKIFFDGDSFPLLNLASIVPGVHRSLISRLFLKLLKSKLKSEIVSLMSSLVLCRTSSCFPRGTYVRWRLNDPETLHVTTAAIPFFKTTNMIIKTLAERRTEISFLCWH